jgi:hypothetical protein
VDFVKKMHNVKIDFSLPLVSLLNSTAEAFTRQ